MKFKCFIIFGLTLVLVVGLVFQVDAGHQKKKGASAAEELLIPIGARGSALGGSCLASINGSSAIFWNPAGLANTSQVVEAMFSHHAYIADIGVSYAAVGVRTGLGSIGVSFTTFSFGNIDVTTEDAPEGTGATFSPTYMNFGVTYSKAMTDRIYIGANAKLITEKIMEMTSSGFAFDMGVQYVSAIGVRLGIVMKNWGPSMKFDGGNLEHRVTITGTEPQTPDTRLRVLSSESELPSTFEIGIAYDYKPMESWQVTAMGNFRNHNFASDEMAGGLELSFNNMFYLRGAYSLSPDEGDDVTGSKSYLFGPSFGFGFSYPVSQAVRISLDYAYRTAEYFDSNQFFSITFGF